MYFDALAKQFKFKLDTPREKLPPEVLDIILYGTKGEKLTLHYDQPRGKGTLYQPFEGLSTTWSAATGRPTATAARRDLEDLMTECPCPTCHGRRLRKELLAVTVGDRPSTSSRLAGGPGPGVMDPSGADTPPAAHRRPDP